MFLKCILKSKNMYYTVRKIDYKIIIFNTHLKMFIDFMGTWDDNT